MANQLYDEFRERDLVYIQVILDDPPGTGYPTWQDADTWAHNYDHDGDGTNDPPLKIIVIADTDGQLWARYGDCPFTSQDRYHDPGTVAIETCRFSNFCQTCGGYTASQSLWDSILPTKECGEQHD